MAAVPGILAALPYDSSDFAATLITPYSAVPTILARLVLDSAGTRCSGPACSA